MAMFIQKGIRLVLLSLMLGLGACASMEELSQARIQRMQLQAREAEARAQLTAAQVAAARAAGQSCSNTTVVDNNAYVGVDTQGRVVCTTPGVTVSNEARLPPAAQSWQGHSWSRTAGRYSYSGGSAYWNGGYRRHPMPGYAPYGYQPYWDGREWVCTNPWSGSFRCLRQ